MSDRKGSEPIERILDLLNRWRHLPAYRLESRVDMLFALYLPEVLEKIFCVKIKKPVIPEFPIKFPTKRKNDDEVRPEYNTSKKVDFFALQESKRHGYESQAFLVELKTDMGSRRKSQDKYLDYAVRRGLRQLVGDILDLCKTTKERQKYVHLLWYLAELRLIEGPEEEIERLCDSIESACGRSEKIARTRMFRDALYSLKAAEVSCFELELVYIQPRKCQEDPSDRCVIDFNRFAEIVEGGPEGADDFRTTFAHYLREWADKDAGGRDPRDFS